MLSSSKIDWTRTGLLCVLILAIASMVYNWYRPPNTVTTQQYVPVPQIKQVEKLRTVEVPVEKVVVVEKEKLVEVVKYLPAEIKNDPNKQVTASASLGSTRTGYDVLATIDTKTGVSGIVAKEKPLPLLGFPSDVEAGIRYGLSSQQGQGGSVYGRYRFLRVGNAHLGAYGEASTTPEAKVMLDLSYRF